MADTPREGGTPQPIMPKKQCIIDFFETSNYKKMYNQVYIAEEAAKEKKETLRRAIEQYGALVRAEKLQRQAQRNTDDATDNEVDDEASPPVKPGPRKKMSEDDRRDRRKKWKEKRRAEKNEFDEFQKTRSERRRNETRKPYIPDESKRAPVQKKVKAFGKKSFVEWRVICDNHRQ